MSGNFIVPFGKYKGKKLKEIDDLLYLVWMRNLDDLYGDTKSALDEWLEQPENEQLLDELQEERARQRGE